MNTTCHKISHFKDCLLSTARSLSFSLSLHQTPNWQTSLSFHHCQFTSVHFLQGNDFLSFQTTALITGSWSSKKKSSLWIFWGFFPSRNSLISAGLFNFNVFWVGQIKHIKNINSSSFSFIQRPHDWPVHEHTIRGKKGEQSGGK